MKRKLALLLTLIGTFCLTTWYLQTLKPIEPTPLAWEIHADVRETLLDLFSDHSHKILEQQTTNTHSSQINFEGRLNWKMLEKTNNEGRIHRDAW